MRVFLALLLLVPLITRADDASVDPASFLFKIRSRLMGDWPTVDEWNQLEAEMLVRKCGMPSCMTDFFQKKIHEYMQSKNYVSNMLLKADEAIWVRSPNMPEQFLAASDRNLRDSYEFNNAFYNLIRQVFSENLSWDAVFTGQQYKINQSPQQTGASITELVFYKQGNTRLTVDSAGKVLSGSARVDFTGHPNVSGVFSTPKFLERFWNSSINQNRKRSAAVLRIMLCDSKPPSIERKSQALEERTRAMGYTIEQLNSMHRPGKILSRHASDPACIKCHQRIDPIAWTIRGMELGIMDTAVPGRLRYYSSENTLTDIEASGFHDLVAKVTRQSLYRTCQVDKFITWIIGNDVPVSPARHQEIEAKFDSVGRRVNDFIEFLLLSPEFQTGQSKIGSEKVSEKLGGWLQAQGVFKNCNYCHGTLPFGENPSKVQERITGIVGALDLRHDGRNRVMPPREHFWQPSQQDLAAIKSWVISGAADSTGEPRLAPEVVKAILEGK